MLFLFIFADISADRNIGDCLVESPMGKRIPSGNSQNRMANKKSAQWALFVC